jgi:CheY-like chemotaxis protein
MKSEFISIVSHELRTPLTSIKGSLGLLLGGAAGTLPEKMEQLLQIAQNNSDRLIRLINDILDISKIEAGRIEMTREPVDLSEVAQVAAQGLEAMAASSQVQIEVEAPEKGALVVNGDRDRLLQVTTNLISNAIKFSPPGSAVTVCAEAEVHMAEVNVIDRGPGIPAEHQAKLFQKFYQVDSSSARAKSGTGLGLAISHALIREHGGLIGVESAEGQGSRFWFTLPLLSRPHVGGMGSEKKRPRVLVCDDDRDIANLISHLLQDGGYTCDQVYSGPELLERVKREHYDIITLDLAMPGMDGLEVARQLQEDPQWDDLPIVFVSVYKESPQAKSLHLAGWITKPIDEAVFLDAVRRALRMRHASLNGRKRQGDPLILLVDDDADVLKVVGAMVESAGMRVSSAQGGGEALKKIREEEPDAVVLDLMMPGIDGFEVISTLRQSERTAHIPVLVLTAKDLTKEEQERLQSEETRFLTKSYASQKAILDDLSSLLHNYEGKTI